MISENKIEEISKRLIDAGFQKVVINKPNEENFHSINEIDFICELTHISGNSKEAKEFNDEYKKMLLNDYIPEITFMRKDFELEFYLKKNAIKVTTKNQENTISACGIEAVEIVPFKNIDIDEFYKMLVEKSYNLNILLINGSN